MSDLGAVLAASIGPPPDTLVIAWSGGVDSTVLLDLAVGGGPLSEHLSATRVVAAHLDHGMHPDSASTAAALARTAEAWGVDFIVDRLARVPASEAEARDARYAFLRRVCDEVDADQLWTAHHADDQVETVLFRVARGTGVAGLQGVPERAGSIRRPYLVVDPPVSRAEIAARAAERDLPLCIDPTNAEAIAARNRIRHEVLPLLEEVVPGTRPALLRLARNARRAEEELDALAAFALDRGGFDAEVWAEAPTALRRALLRFAARRLGVSLSEAATGAALAVDPGAQSGRGIDLPGGLRFERTFERWTLRRTTGTETSSGSVVLADREGEGRLVLGDRQVAVRWGPAADDSSLRVEVGPTAWPLVLRGWRAGDRLRRPFGSSPLVKLWAEARVPAHERSSRWVLADATGTPLAAEGLGAASSDRTIREGDPSLDRPPEALHIHMDVLT